MAVPLGYDLSVEPSQDVVVVGAGIIGCAIASELARRGARVRVFEARSVAAGATQASAGVLAPYIEARERGPLFDLAIRSLAMYDGFVAQVMEQSGVDIEYRRCGTLELAVDPSARRQELPLDAGDVRWITGDEARRLEPALPTSIEGALLAPAHGYVAVTALTEALSWAALRHGVEIETGRRVIDIRRAAGHLRLTTDDGTNWETPSVVLAAGSWSGAVGVTEPAALDVRPIRGQLLRLGWRGVPITRVLWGPDCYLVPWQDGTVLVGATVEEVGFDERATAAGVRDLLDAVCELLPEAWGATFLEARVGLRPATTDGLPIIGPSEQLEGLVYATGHYRNGILLAPLTAALVADLILDATIDPALHATRAGRFVHPAC